MRDRIKEVMANSFDIPLSDITDDAEINSIANWDSLSHMILMLELEAEFSVTIPTEKIASLLSLDQIETYIQEYALQKESEDTTGKAQH
ncbi:MAG: acyl carrier protein [Anaerolineales bacterium]|jgi:acyl carrier protein